MLRSLCLPLLGLALLAETAVAQTTPATRPAPHKTTTRTTKTTGTHLAPNNTPAARRRAADPLRGTNGTSKGVSGYAAPGEPVQDPRYNGKNTPPYDGPAAPTKRNTTLSTPK